MIDEQPAGAYLTVREVAQLARCEHKAVRRAIAAGRLPAIQPVRAILVREHDARAWIEARPVAARHPAPARATARQRKPPAAGVGSVSHLKATEEAMSA